MWVGCLLLYCNRICLGSCTIRFYVFTFHYSTTILGNVSSFGLVDKITHDIKKDLTFYKN